MTIKKDMVYTIKEVHDILGIHPKKLNRIASSNKIQKIDNRYIFDGSFLIEYFDLTDVQECLKVSKDSNQLDLELEALKQENEELKKQVEDLEQELEDLKTAHSSTDEEYEKTTDELSQIDNLLKEYKVIDDTDIIENDGGNFISVIGLKKYLQENESLTKQVAELSTLFIDNQRLNSLVLELSEKLSSYDISPNEDYQTKLREAIELITIEAMRQGVTHKIFSDEEYQDIIGTLDRVEQQQEQVQYLRKRIEQQDDYLQKLLKSIEQRNFIEAKEKNFDKEKDDTKTYDV